MTAMPLEERVAQLEAEVAQLKRRLENAPALTSPWWKSPVGTFADNQAAEEVELASTPTPSDDWLAKVTGSITDEEAFLEALEFGRAFRYADRPVEEAVEPA